MPTDKQIAANRRNALLSTGPRTDSGKQRSRYNGLQHGLYAEAAILPHEDREEFEKLRAALHADHPPATATEQMLFDDLVLAYWRMRRAQLFLDVYLRQATNGSSTRSLAYDHPDDVLPILGEMLHTDRRIARIDTLTQMENRYRNAWYRAQKELHRLQQERLADEETPIEPEPLPSTGSTDPEPQATPEPSESSTAQPTENENQTQELASVLKVGQASACAGLQPRLPLLTLVPRSTHVPRRSEVARIRF